MEKSLSPNVPAENALLLDADLIHGLAESYFALGMPPGNDKPNAEPRRRRGYSPSVDFRRNIW